MLKLASIVIGESYYWLQVQGFASRNTFDDLHEDVDALVEAVWRRLLVDDAVEFGQNGGHGLDEPKRIVVGFEMRCFGPR